MQPLNQSPTLRGLAAIGGLLAATVAGVIGIVFTVIFAATVVAIAIVAAIVLGLVLLAVRARRWMKGAPKAAAADIIEARRVGGHSWVAYGWDNRR